jgi:hypothetical protein
MRIQDVVDKIILKAFLDWNPRPGKPGDSIKRLSAEERKLLEKAKPEHFDTRLK